MEVFGLKAKLAVIEALGLDAHLVTSLKLEMNGKEAPLVTVSMWVRDEQLNRLAEALKGFELVEKWEVLGDGHDAGAGGN
jgi:hypothetical protein